MPHHTNEQADNRHPVDYIEPLDERTMSDRAVVLARLLDVVFPGNASINPGERFEVAFRRFVAICMCIRPELFAGQSQITIGKFLGCSSANLSKLLTGLADELGIRSPSMETDDARAAKSAAQRNRAAASVHGLTAEQKHQHSVNLAIVQAKKKMESGKPWSRFEKLSLFERGYLDDAGEMTEQGRAYLGVVIGDDDQVPDVCPVARDPFPQP